jgi:hypothetical protein
MLAAQFGDVPYRVKFDYLAPALQPVTGIMNLCTPTINPTKTYDSATEEGIQYDILWVPAGMSSYIFTHRDFTANSQDLFLTLPREPIEPPQPKLPSSKHRLLRHST